MMSAFTFPAGILPPIATPFRGERFDAAAMGSNVTRWNEAPLAGYVVAGSNGEGPYLSDDLLAAVVESVAAAAPSDRVIVAGTGRETTTATIERTRRAANAGAHAALVVAPSYFRAQMTPAALARHYRAVADASPVPILLYHVPKFAPVVFGADLVLALAEHPRIAGIKETSGDMTLFASILKDRPESFRVFVGSANQLLAGMALGADGGILALANIAPRLCARLAALAAEGNLAEAREIQFRLLPVNQAITAEFGIPGLKFAMELLGYAAGDSLPPLLPLEKAAEEEIRRRLADAALSPGKQH